MQREEDVQKFCVNAAGNRVLLRAVKEQDHELLQSLIHDPDIVKVTKGYSGCAFCALQTDGSCCAPDTAGGLRSIIVDRKNPETGLGVIMLSPTGLQGAAEIRIKLVKYARGRGYAKDAVNALVSFAFREPGLDCIYASILEHNTASRRLFEACGFLQEDVHKSRADKEGHCRSVCSYVIRNPEKRKRAFLRAP